MIDYEQLRAALDKKIAADPSLRAVMKRVKNGTATLTDSAEYARVLSHILGREVSASILNLDDRESAVTQLLHDSYDDVNSIYAQTQSILDEQAGIHITPKKPSFPAERVEQFVHSLVDPTVKDSVIKRRARAGTETITKSFHDNCIKVNAQFRHDAGLKCYIVRIGTKCCEWCTEVAGKYRFGEQPDGIFRRHDNCDCTIIYDGQVLRGKQNADGSRSKTWEELPNANAADYTAPTLSEAEGRAVEQRNLAQFRGLPQNQNYKVTPKSNQNAYSVDRDLVNSKTYHDKFDNLTPHKAANENIYQQSKRLLEHRDGSDSESLIVLDSRTGKLIVDNFKNPDQNLKTKLTDEQYDLVQRHNGSFIMLHNHPAGVRPSGTDILTLWGQPKADRTIIVGHDGSIFDISNINREIPLDKIYKNAYNNAVENNIPKDYAKIIATNALYDTRAFDYVVR